MNARIIAPVGWKYIASAFVVAYLLSYFVEWWAGIPLVLMGCWLVFSFRDPPREVPSEPLGIVSPIDGVILDVEPVQDPCCGMRNAHRIYMRISRISAFPLRSPTEGKVETADRSAEGDHQASWVVRTDENDLIAVRVRWRYSILRGGKTYVRFGQRIGQGQRCGSVPLRSLVEVFVPESAQIKVQAGDRVKAGIHVIAQLAEH